MITWARRGFDRPYLLLLLTTMFWAANANAGKLAVGVIDPILLTQLRWLITALLSLCLARPYLQADWPVIRRHIGRLAVLSFFGFAGFNVLLYSALQFTSVVNVSIEQASIPLFILLLNVSFFAQRAAVWQYLGALIGLVGVAVTVSGGQWDNLRALALNVGDLLMLSACVLYAVYSLLLRQRPPLHGLSLMSIMASCSALGMLPLTAYQASQGMLLFEGAMAWWIVAFVVIFPSFLAQLFYIRSVDLMGANRAGVFINLVPIFGSLFAVVLLGERFQAYHWAGLLLVLSGIAMAESSGRRKANG